MATGSGGGVPNIAPGFLTQGMIQRKAAERLERQIQAEKDLADRRAWQKLGLDVAGAAMDFGTKAYIQSKQEAHERLKLGEVEEPESGWEFDDKASAAPVAQPAQPTVTEAAKARVNLPDASVPALSTALSRPAGPSHSLLGEAKPREPFGGVTMQRRQLRRPERTYLKGALDVAEPGEPTPVEAPSPAPAPPPQAPAEVKEPVKAVRGEGVITPGGRFMPERVFKQKFPDPKARAKVRLKLSLLRKRNATSAYQERLAQHLEHQEEMAAAKAVREDKKLRLNWREYGLTKERAKAEAWDRSAKMMAKYSFVNVGNHRWIQSRLQLKITKDVDPSSEWYQWPIIEGLTSGERATLATTGGGGTKEPATGKDKIFDVEVTPPGEYKGGRKKVRAYRPVYLVNIKDAARHGAVPNIGAVFQSGEIKSVNKGIQLLSEGMRTGDADKKAKGRALLSKRSVKVRMRQWMMLQESGKLASIPQQKQAAKKAARATARTAEDRATDAWNKNVKGAFTRINGAIDKYETTTNKKETISDKRKAELIAAYKKKKKKTYIVLLDRAYKALKNTAAYAGDEAFRERFWLAEEAPNFKAWKQKELNRVFY